MIAQGKFEIIHAAAEEKDSLLSISKMYCSGVAFGILRMETDGFGERGA